jgi:hypothetical protein
VVASFVAVLDAWVLIPAALRDVLLRAAERGLYRPHWSETILTEVHRNFVTLPNVTEERALRLITVLRSHFEDALVQPDERLIAAP